MDSVGITDFRSFWNSFRRRSMAMIGLIMLIIAILTAAFAPQIAPYDPKAPIRVTIDDIYAAPSAAHWLGTDDAGRDVFSSFVYGARVSLMVGFFASFISIVIGGMIGIVAGFYGGRTENVLMRFTDIMLVIPDLPLIVVIVALTKPSLTNIILVIGLLGWTGTSRLVRSQTLSVKARKFVQRAQAIGAARPYIIRRHILPAGAAAAGRQHGAGHLAGDPQRKHAQLFGPGRSDHAKLGADAQLRLYAGRHERGRVVGAGPAGLWHCVGGAGVYAAGPGSGTGAESAVAKRIIWPRSATRLHGSNLGASACRSQFQRQ